MILFFSECNEVIIIHPSIHQSVYQSIHPSIHPGSGLRGPDLPLPSHSMGILRHFQATCWHLSSSMSSVFPRASSWYDILKTLTRGYPGGVPTRCPASSGSSGCRGAAARMHQDRRTPSDLPPLLSCSWSAMIHQAFCLRALHVQLLQRQSWPNRQKSSHGVLCWAAPPSVTC